MISRRSLIVSLGIGSFLGFSATQMAEASDFPVTLTDGEWRERLTPAQHAVLRRHRTERAFTNSLLGERSPLLDNARSGVYVCAGCLHPLYDSQTKFDSRTGWPSFFDARPEAVGTQIDRSFFISRTEVHCAQCGGHLGHVFPDGPPPTGLRHCINGLALLFVPEGSDQPEGHPVAF